ncbi:MAG: response regulator transcription factor [Sphingobacteriia bacterium]|nr:response regulator transcription factor [Sphingobacteriia bacterium]
MKPKTARIALVDDHTLFRNGLSSLLSEFTDIEVAFEACGGKELQNKIETDPEIDVILMDINMPVMDGFEATLWMTQHYPLVKIIALSMYDEDTTIIKMLRAGACGYVLKESTPSELHKAIFSVLEKGYYSNDLVSASVIKSIHSSNNNGAGQLVFSDKELIFMQHCASELTYKEIAHEMGVAVRTVDNYREALFSRLDIKSRVGLVLWGLKRGYIKL